MYSPASTPANISCKIPFNDKYIRVCPRLPPRRTSICAAKEGSFQKLAVARIRQKKRQGHNSGQAHSAGIEALAGADRRNRNALCKSFAVFARVAVLLLKNKEVSRQGDFFTHFFNGSFALHWLGLRFKIVKNFRYSKFFTMRFYLPRGKEGDEKRFSIIGKLK